MPFDPIRKPAADAEPPGTLEFQLDPFAFTTFAHRLNAGWSAEWARVPVWVTLFQRHLILTKHRTMRIVGEINFAVKKSRDFQLTATLTTHGRGYVQFFDRSGAPYFSTGYFSTGIDPLPSNYLQVGPGFFFDPTAPLFDVVPYVKGSSRIRGAHADLVVVDEKSDMADASAVAMHVFKARGPR